MFRSVSRIEYALCVLLLFCLAFFPLGPLSKGAYAHPLEPAQPNDISVSATQKLTVEQAQAELDSLNAECDALGSDVEGLQADIDDLAAKTMEAQTKMLEGQDALAQAVRQEYKNKSSSHMLNLLLNSKDWKQFNKNLTQIERVIEYQNDIVQTQKDLKADFENRSHALTSQKDEQDAKLQELASKRDEAEAVVQRVNQEAADAARMNALHASIDHISTKSHGPYAGSLEGESQTSSSDSQSGQGGQSGSGQAGSSVGTNGKWVAPISTSWNTGKATAYDIIGGTCANGMKYTEKTMGVAISIYTPGYRSLIKNRMIQINYGNKVVYAYVMDGGGFAKYGVSLDLQRAVYRALSGNQGAVARDWGKRTVSYRLL